MNTEIVDEGEISELAREFIKAVASNGLALTELKVTWRDGGNFSAITKGKKHIRKQDMLDEEGDDGSAFIGEIGRL